MELLTGSKRPPFSSQYEMFAFIALFGLVTTARGHRLGISPTPLDGRIVGGKPIDIGTAAFQVSLQLYPSGRHICGGVIISKDYVLTAAHCVSRGGEYQIRAGSAIRNKGGVVVKVVQITIHPKYVNYRNDIAVLRLKSPLPIGKHIRPVKMAALNEVVAAGISCFVSGWGVTEMGGSSLPDHLQAVYLFIMNHEKCRNTYPSLTSAMICARTKIGGKDACLGDAGGPLIANQKLVGIGSWGRGCAIPEYPGVYASIPALRQFIKQVSGV